MQLDWPGLLLELQDRLEIASRAVIVVILLDDPTEATQVGVQLRGVLPTESVLQIVSDGEQVHAELARLNAARDGLLRTVRAVVFVCPDSEALRLLRRLTQDLTASIDLFVELQHIRVLDYPTLHRRLWEVHSQAYGELDLTGLIPHHSAVTRIPMREIWEPRQLGPFKSRFPREEPERPPPQAPKNSPLRMVLGEPGSGKSALLRWWALEATPEATAPCTLLISLAHWAAQSEMRVLPLLRYLERRVGALLGEQSVELSPHLCKMRVLLDGLDEVPEAWQRARLLDEGESLVKAHPGLELVVSGREWVEEELPEARRERWSLKQLQPLGSESAQQLVRRLLTVRLGPMTTESTGSVIRLTRELLTHRDFWRFQTNPLMLTFVSLLTAFNRGIPERQVELYNDLVEMLIVSWRAVRSGTGRRMSRAEVLRVVAPLGWAMVERGVAGLSEPQLLEVLAETDTLETNPKQRQKAARQRLEHLREDSALLLTSDGLWRFHHATIGEFLAARGVMQSPRLLERLCASILQTQWRQVALFVMGLATVIEPRDDVVVKVLEAVTEEIEMGTPRDEFNRRRAFHLSVRILEINPSIPVSWRIRMARRFLSPAFWVQLPIKQTIDELIICLRLSANEVVDLIVETLCGWEEHSLKKLAWVCFRTPTSDITCTTWGDLSPLVDRCAASTDPDVRALAWRIWVGTSAARAEQVGLLDPEVEWLWRSAPAGGLTWWHDDPARRPEPPPELTEVMARYFPSIQSTY